MAVASPTCPYCNALVDTSAGPGQRVVCPRCGEAFTLRADAIRTTPAPAPSGVQAEAPPAPAAPPRPPGRNRMVGGIVLSVMLLMAAVGLTFALVTQSLRRAHDTGLPRKSRAPEDDLAVLGYLPKGTNVVVGLNWAKLNEDPAGRAFLARKVRVGPAEVPLSELPAWVGLDSDNVRLIVAGLVVDRGALPQFVLLVRTRDHIDPGEHRLRLRNPQRMTSGGREMTQFEPPGLPNGLSAFVVYPDDQTLAVSVFASNLEGVPGQPAQGFDNLNGDLAELLRHTVDPSGPVWLAGASDDWSRTAAGVLLGRLPPPAREALGGVRKFGVWVRAGDPAADAPVNLHAELRCRDEAAARDAGTWLLGRPLWIQTAETSVKVEGPWVTYQRRLPLKELRLLGER
jgi:hypothetical protein